MLYSRQIKPWELKIEELNLIKIPGQRQPSYPQEIQVLLLLLLTSHQQKSLIAWINIIPFWIGETSVGALSQNLLCPRVLPCEVWLYSRGHSFAFLPGGFKSSADRALCVWKPGCISQAER
ncbi:uncharacterized protein LOC124318139 [Daphnia pulicaria]|uniref:uncharacterized protein LOC124318139 n=1 Tax=Daphnia pulicaria TaxID=35523 RepID=UPI001EEBEF79|nr:uncharacterized protein LOC124318139 [Daphnia pulicaria]